MFLLDTFFMTKFAVISDIHGNLHALEAVVRDLKNQSPRQVIVAGDIVGRGPQSQKTLELVAEHQWTVIQGNHEEYWYQCARGNTPPDWQDGWWEPTRSQIEALSPYWIDWMESLPTEHIIDIAGATPIQVVHGSPRRLNEGLYAHDSDEQLQKVLRSTDYPIIVGAHTHIPMDRRVGDVWAMNCGSVGAPFNGSPAAQYLLLTWNHGTWHAEFRQVNYDHMAALHYWHTSGYIDSGVAAQVFAHELETASFHFWHYVRYCKAYQLKYNMPESFFQYRKEFPAFQQFCEEQGLPLYEIDSLIRHRRETQR